MNKLVLTAFVALLAPGIAHAFCPTPEVLKPKPGQVTGCPVFDHAFLGGFLWSDMVDEFPYDNNLYGFATAANGVDRSHQVNQITAIVSANETLDKLGLALIPVTFTPSTTQFDTPDGPTILITDDGIQQGFSPSDNAVCEISPVLSLDTLPGGVAGCPTYIVTTPTAVWWRIFGDSNLYGVLTTVADAVDRRFEANQVTTTVVHNWLLTQLNDATGGNYTLTSVKFTLTNRQFATPDGPATIVLNEGIAEGF